MSDDTLPELTKHDLLARVRVGLQDERQEDRCSPLDSMYGDDGTRSYQPLISIADSLDHHVQRLARLSRPRTQLPGWLKKRFIFFRIPALELLAVKVYSLLFANSHEGLRETSYCLDLISQALRSIATGRGKSRRS